jgi:hypothetical protein
MGILIGIVAAFLIFKSGILSSLNLGATGISSGYVAPPPTVVTAPQAGQIQQEQLVAQGVGTGISTATQDLSKVSNLVPVIGPAISAAFSLLAGSLIAASAARAKAATSENTAVARAVPGWDQAVAQIVAAYNAGNISAVQVDSLLSTIMANYWNEVTPQIQSGRNGCQGGATCPQSVAPNSGSATATTAPSSYCSGDIGAACCVGCADLQLSVDNMEWAVANANKTGQATTAFIQQVFASKYGGANRSSYLVTFVPPISGVTG